MGWEPIVGFGWCEADGDLLPRFDVAPWTIGSTVARAPHCATTRHTLSPPTRRLDVGDVRRGRGVTKPVWRVMGTACARYTNRISNATQPCGRSDQAHARSRFAVGWSNRNWIQRCRSGTVRRLGSAWTQWELRPSVCVELSVAARSITGDEWRAYPLLFVPALPTDLGARLDISFAPASGHPRISSIRPCGLFE